MSLVFRRKTRASLLPSNSHRSSLYNKRSFPAFSFFFLLFVHTPRKKPLEVLPSIAIREDRGSFSSRRYARKHTHAHANNRSHSLSLSLNFTFIHTRTRCSIRDKSAEAKDRGRRCREKKFRTKDEKTFLCSLFLSLARARVKKNRGRTTIFVPTKYNLSIRLRNYIEHYLYNR